MTASSNSGALRAVAHDGNSEEIQARGADAGQPAEADVRTETPVTKKRRNKVLPVVLLALLAGAGWYGYGWWTDGRFMISTDDAYIEGDIAIISPKVSGYVAKVNVTENQQVRAGAPLVTLDGGDYQLALERARTGIESANLAVKRIDAQIVGAQAALKQAQAQQGALEAALRGAQITAKRAGELAAKSVGTTADLDNAQVALEQARANLVAGQASVTSAQANIGLLEAERNEALNTIRTQELARDQAQRDQDFTVL
jgi:membrane fusion protein (multidrug efflux system)